MTAPDEILVKRGVFGGAAGVITELRRNKRALAGLLAIVALAAGYGLLVLSDAVTAQRAAYLETGRQIGRLAAVAQEKDWPARAAASAGVRQSFEQRLWLADSDGVARADLQDWVTNAAHAVGLDRLQVAIELSHPKDLPADLREVTARITGAQTEASLEGFLTRVSADPHLLVVERLHAQQRPLPLLELTLATWAKIGGPAAAAAAAK